MLCNDGTNIINRLYSALREEILKGRGLKQYTCNFITRSVKFKMGNCPSA